MSARTPTRTVRTRIARALGHRRMARALLALVAAPLLAACGAIPGVGGAVDLGDPLKLDGYRFSAIVRDGALATQGLSHASKAMSTDDMGDLNTRLYGYEVTAFEANVGLAPEATLRNLDPADAPERFVLSRAHIDARLSDDHASAHFLDERSLELPFERDACTAAGCTYRYAGDADLSTVLDVAWSDRALLTDLVTVLTEDDGSGDNTARIETSLEVDSRGSLEGAAIEFRLTSGGSHIVLE